MASALKCLSFLARGSATKFTRCLSTRTSTNIPSASSAFPFNFANSWVWQKSEPIKLPIGNIKPIYVPGNICIRITQLIEPNNSVTDKTIEEPLAINNATKEAARLIVIRRKKMKKHKLRKLRKRMKYEYAKVRQRRELKKEKEFQAGLIAQYKKAEAFSAEEYVANKIKQANEQPPLPFTKTAEYKELMRQKQLRLNINK